MKRDNKEQTLVKKKWLEAKRIRVMEVVIEGVDLLNKVRKCKVRDDEVIKAVKEMKWAGVKMLRDKEWHQEDSLILKEGKVYVCHKLPVQTKNSTARRMGRKRAILRWTRQRVLIIEKGRK